MNKNYLPYILILGLASQQAFAEYGFDRMRCKGKLIEKYDTLDFVIEHCGQPIAERNWGNGYQTKNYLEFEATGARYFMRFINNRLVESRQEVHGY